MPDITHTDSLCIINAESNTIFSAGKPHEAVGVSGTGGSHVLPTPQT